MLDSPEELLAKIRLGEDSELELKAVQFTGRRVSGPAREYFADELAAMGNAGGGVCVLGVDDKSRDILGIDLDRLDQVESWVREACNDSIKPALQVRIIRTELPDSLGQSKAVIKVEVPRSLWVHKSPGGYFVRQGSSKRELSPDVLARLFQQRSQARIIRFDEQVVPGTDFNTLDEMYWKRFLRPGSEGDKTFLRKLKVLALDEQGAELATVGGVLLCTRRPDAHLTGAAITAVCYGGRDQDSNYQVDAHEITGPLDLQIAEALSFVRRNMRVQARKEPGRVDLPQFSERAVFEAIVNAVAHRDYSIHGSKIRLFLFNDRLELYSPGALPNSLTLESLALRQVTRNELVTSLLAWLPVDLGGTIGRQRLLEKRGEGVPAIIRETRALAGRDPVYRMIDDAELLLTIPAAGT
jgi:predicted HTH transcriptional regulator